MISKILLKRGDIDDMPILDIGEPAIALDEEALYVGTAEGNVKVSKTNTLVMTTQYTGNARNLGGSNSIFFNVPVQIFTPMSTPPYLDKTISVYSLTLKNSSGEVVSGATVTPVFEDSFFNVNVTGVTPSPELYLFYSFDIDYEYVSEEPSGNGE